MGALAKLSAPCCITIACIVIAQFLSPGRAFVRSSRITCLTDMRSTDLPSGESCLAFGDHD